VAIVLLITAFVSAFVIFFLSNTDKEGKFRASILKALILQSCLIAVSIEVLSSISALDFAHIALFWFLISIVNLVVLWLRYRSLINRDLVKSIVAEFKLLKQFSRRYIAIVTTIVVISLVICLIAPPNNFDSMTYHMSRVMHWIQNRSVEYYPTHITRQIYMPPGASYIVAHFQILAGGDLFATSVQWLAFVGSILGVSLITKELIGDRAQWVSMLICATIPMAIAQSTTTQTDLVTSFWLVCFTYFLFKFQQHDRSDLFWMAASLGLAIATKPTAVVFGFPLLVVFAFLIVGDSLQRTQNLSLSLSNSFKYFSLVGLGSLILPMPSWMRNFRAVGDFFGADQTTRSQIYGLSEFLSNFFKNLALNVPIPGFTQLVVGIHEHLLRANINEPRLNFAAIPFDTVMMSPITLLIPSEDNIANPLHFILGILACLNVLYVFFRRNDGKHLKVCLLSIATFSGFLLFCYLLKWQPWGNRLMLPLFFLQAPIVAHYLTTSSILQKFRVSQVVLSFASIVAVFYALTPIRHPLIALPTQQWSPTYLGGHQSASILLLKRDDIYYSGSGKAVKSLHHNAVDTVVGQYQCRRIGFFSGQDEWEYPIWVLLNKKTSNDFRLKHIAVQNESKNLKSEFPDSEMCAILTSQGKTLQVKPEQTSSENQSSR